MTKAAKWVLGLSVLALLIGLYYLGPIISPFVTGAILAYLFDPLVNRLQRYKIPRTIGVIVVFFVILAIFAVLIGFVFPIIENQILILINKIPAMINWLQELAQTYLHRDIKLAIAQKLEASGQEGLKSAGGVFTEIVRTLTRSGFAVVSSLTNLLLIPVVLFYLLRDWHSVVRGVHGLLPRSSVATVDSLLNQSDEVLSAFLRGQLLVMIGLAIMYSVGLSVVGLDLAVLIGVVSGIVSIVPYLGFIVGIIAASLAAMFQFHDAIYLVYVLIVFLVANGVEGAVLTPLLVGDKIGLHPVAVIFAVLAGGQLFGFVGILLALPVAAVIMVFVRYFLSHYKQSKAYVNEAQPGT